MSLNSIPLQVSLLIVAFLVTVIWGVIAMPILTKLKVGQTIRDDGPKSHAVKSGTPTMGGIIFLGGFALLMLGCAYRYSSMRITLLLLLVTVLAFAAIGFIDDYLKVVKKSSIGLKAWQKMFLLLIVSGVFVYFITYVLNIGTETYIPIWGKYIDLGKYYVPFAILVLLSTTNVVNITDGLDGLATGVMTILMAFFTIVGIMLENIEIVIFSAILTGSCLGFLVYNINPARVFMGDTGSLALGGALGIISLMVEMPVLLIVVAGVCVLEALSDILQVLYFKATHGKRLFKMAPLHHHFELCGMSEQKIVWMFWIVTIILCGIGIILI